MERRVRIFNQGDGIPNSQCLANASISFIFFIFFLWPDNERRVKDDLKSLVFFGTFGPTRNYP